MKEKKKLLICAIGMILTVWGIRNIYKVNYSSLDLLFLAFAAIALFYHDVSRDSKNKWKFYCFVLLAAVSLLLHIFELPRFTMYTGNI